MRDNVQREQDKHKAIRELDCCVNLLIELSEDLYNVGFIPLSNRVEKVVARMRPALKELDKIDGEDVRDQLKQAQEGSFNVLKAALAGAELGRNENNGSV